jgi:pimeloyl-ACP methyl ester carboxylesterase
MNLARLSDRWQLKALSKHIPIHAHTLEFSIQMTDERVETVPLVEWIYHQDSDDKIKDPLVLVHGLGSSAGSYSQFILYASKYFDCILACSAPSHGMTPVHSSACHQEELYRVWEHYLLKASQERPIILMGNSLGGAVALRFSLSYPKRVKSLVLCSPAGAMLNASDIQFIRANFDMSSIWGGHRFLKKLFVKLPRFWMILGFFIRASLSRKEISSLLSVLKAGDGMDGNTLRTLQPPSLIFWGTEDQILPNRLLHYYKKHMPKTCSFVTHHKLGHSPQMEDGKLLLQEVIQWLNYLDKDSYERI